LDKDKSVIEVLAIFPSQNGKGEIGKSKAQGNEKWVKNNVGLRRLGKREQISSKQVPIAFSGDFINRIHPE
jgi:hypothetical protein